MTYINIHTHHLHAPEGIAIKNLLVQDYDATQEPQGLFSVGWHPWHITSLKDQSQKFLQRMEQSAANPRMAAFGEAGLDKSIETPLEWQVQALEMQARLAEKYQKPMIIHCVRAFQEIVACRKKFPTSPPWIIHGYTGSWQLAQQLVDAGFYLSFGPALVKGHQKTLESLRHVPREKIFLETDEQQMNIEEVYEYAARQLEVPAEGLQKVIHKTFTRLFKNIDER